MDLFRPVGKGDVVDDARVEQQHLADPASRRKDKAAGRVGWGSGRVGVRRRTGGRSVAAYGARMVGIGRPAIDLVADEGEAEYDQDADHGEDALYDAHGNPNPLNARPGVSRDPRHAAEDFDDELLDPEFAETGGAEPLAAATHEVMVAEAQAGQRLDKVLSDSLADQGLSRSRLKALIEQGLVAAGGATIDEPSHRVKPGDRITVQVPAAAAAVPTAQAIPLSVVYEDADLLVIDKTAGMVVHPAAGNPDGTLVNALLAHCGDALSGIGGVRRPGIVHRLDKDTSGLMVVAKTDRAHQGLSAQFADRSLSRTYRAVVWGSPMPRTGEVDAPIGRHPQDRKRMAVVPGPNGKPAVTRYSVVRAFGLSAALVECKLLTGRTHQIRVHMTHVGHPLVGDPLYGRLRPPKLRALPGDLREALTAFPRQALHAVALEFLHPATSVRMRFDSPFPNAIQSLIHKLESL